MLGVGLRPGVDVVEQPAEVTKIIMVKAMDTANHLFLSTALLLWPTL